ncbi:hypothetical protein GCM10022221_50300 [Actinocorallia aurea]
METVVIVIASLIPLELIVVALVVAHVIRKSRRTAYNMVASSFQGAGGHGKGRPPGPFSSGGSPFDAFFADAGPSYGSNGQAPYGHDSYGHGSYGHHGHHSGHGHHDHGSWSHHDHGSSSHSSYSDHGSHSSSDSSSSSGSDSSSSSSSDSGSSGSSD